MIKVHNKYTDRYQCSCMGCEILLDFEFEDVKYDTGGSGYILCPACKYKIDIYGFESEITKDNLIYPDHFSSEKFCSKLANGEVDELVQSALNNVYGVDDPWSLLILNDTMVLGFKAEGKTYIFVGHSIETAEIPS